MDGRSAGYVASDSPMMESVPLLSTKLHTPPSRPNRVARPRLIRRLQEGLRTPLTLVSAPAGSGKTTLLADFGLRIANCGFAPSPSASTRDSKSELYRVAWLSLDESDNDPTRFWAYFIAALERAECAIGAESLALLHAPQPPPTTAILTTLINAAADVPHHLVLILDDYHTIEAQSIHEGLTFLLDHMPPNLHLVIATRADPPLPLARLRARGRLTELRAADLRFTLEEAATFLNQVMGLNLSAEDVAALEARTEGWITGLQLAALSMQGRGDISDFIQTFTGSHRYVLDYLAEEVFQRQPEDVQTFLLRTSILKRLTGPLCDTLLEIGDQRLEISAHTQSPISNLQSPSQSMLERLERANLFLVPLDDDRRWYRYHPLFTEFLQAQLQRTQPDLVPELHRRAAEWYAENELIAEGVEHALIAGDFEHAAHLIERVSHVLLSRREVNTLLKWLDALPSEQVRTRPTLCLHHAWACLFAGQLDAAETRLQDLERQSMDEDREVRAHVTTIRSIIACYRGQVSQAVELSRQALEALPKEAISLRVMVAINIMLNLFDSPSVGSEVAKVQQIMEEAVRACRAAGDAYTTVAALNFLARLEAVRGQLQQAAASYRQALHLANEHTKQSSQPLLQVGAAHIGLAELLYEWNDLEAAQHHLMAGIAMNEEGKAASVLSEAHITLAEGYATLAKVSQARGDTSSALRYMRRAEEHAQASGSAWLVSQIAARRARLAVALGDLDEAARWARACGLGIGDPVTYRRQDEYTTLARILITLGHLDKALRLLAWLLEVMGQAGLTRWVIELLAVRALALDAQGHLTDALATLERALTLAEPEGYVRLFVDEGAPMERLLKRLTANRRPLTAAEYAGRLLAAFRLEGSRLQVEGSVGPSRNLQPATFQPATLIEPLSPREQEVLQLLAAGLTNREIAQELVITAGTVKRHLHNIYGKLGVRNRTQAVARARELGLLEERV